MQSTHKSAKHTIRFTYDTKDAKFFKKNRFSLANSTRGFRVLVHRTGGTLGAARMMLELPDSVQVKLIIPPAIKGKLVHVDMRRKNLHVQRSTLDMMSDVKAKHHEHWIPSSDDAPTRTPDEFDALFIRYRGGDLTALDEILWSAGPLLRGMVAKTRRLNLPDLESKLNLGLLRAAMLWKPGKACFINYARRQLALVVKSAFSYPSQTLPLDMAGQVEVPEGTAPQYHEELVVQPPERLRDDRDILTGYIKRLTKSEQVAVRMFFTDGASKQEIGVEAGYSREAARCAVNRAVKRLKSMLDADGLTIASFRG